MITTNDKELDEAIRTFLPEQEVKVTSIGHGLINSTFKVSNSKCLVLQRLNENVFTSPVSVISNYVTIEGELKKKDPKIIPSLIKTKEGMDYFIDVKKNLWRATEYIQDSKVMHTVDSTEVAGLVAGAFGALTKALSDIGSGLIEIIPGFHDLSWRYQQFTDALGKDVAGRAISSEKEIKMIVTRKKYVDFFDQLSNKPAKLRVMHHDAKVSNVLFDESGKKVLAIVDLDTCQPGYFFSDLGDMIRTIASNSVEDSREIEALRLRDDIYHSLVNGYLNALGEEFTVFEKENIHMSGLLMIYMQSMRFLTDHLNGDTYYKISYEDHNLWRARNQLRLLQQLEELVNKQ